MLPLIETTKWEDDEPPSLFKDVQKRVGQQIECLNNDLSLPANIKKMLDGGLKFGEVEGQNEELQRRLEDLKPTVKKLVQLEVTAQHHYLNLYTAFK